MRPRSYIGFTGAEHGVVVDSVLTEVRKQTDQLIMVGVGVRDDQSNRGPNRYPVGVEWKSIFRSRPNTLNLLHLHTQRPKNLLDDIWFLQELAGEFCHGFQINMVWPDPCVFEAYKKSMPAGHNTIVLGCDHAALRLSGRSPRGLAQKLTEYDGLIDYAVIDQSGGRGLGFYVKYIGQCFEEIAARMPSLGLVIAGGLYADNVERQLSDLLRRWEISCDAEDMLRPVNDFLNVEECVRYIITTAALFRQFERVRVQS